MSRVRELARRVAAGTGVEEVVHLRRRVDALVESVAENRVLEGPLATRVSELERRLVAALEERLRQLDDPRERAVAHDIAPPDTDR